MNEREIALRALRAAGHDQAASLVEAIIRDPGGDPAAAAPAAQEPAAAQLPEGILPLEEVQRQEAAGSSGERGMSHRERMDANDRFIRSAEYHAREENL